MLSISRLRRRKSDFYPNYWILDSAGFSELKKHGKWTVSEEHYAAEIERWGKCGKLIGAIAQDYMCSPAALRYTGLTIAEHQQLTLERYDRLIQLTDYPILPCIQGWEAEDYVQHLRLYGDRLKPGMMVAVGSLVARSNNPAKVAEILTAIKAERPDLIIHALGVKLKGLSNSAVALLTDTSDSMAWCQRARWSGKNHNYVGSAIDYHEDLFKILQRHSMPVVPLPKDQETAMTIVAELHGCESADELLDHLGFDSADDLTMEWFAQQYQALVWNAWYSDLEEDADLQWNPVHYFGLGSHEMEFYHPELLNLPNDRRPKNAIVNFTQTPLAKNKASLSQSIR